MKATTRRTEKANAEGHQRYRQVDDNQPAQPGKGATCHPPAHRDSIALRPPGTEDLLLIFGSMIGTIPFFLRISCPPWPSRNFRKARAAAWCGALFRIVMV